MKMALRQAAQQLGVVAPDITPGSGKALEARVLFELAVAAKATFQVRACDHTGADVTGSKFRLRDGPGHLPPSQGRALHPTCFRLRIADRDFFELHNSIEFRGTSGVEHEVDVSVVWSGEMEEVRRLPKARIPEGPPVIAVELKEYGGQADKSLMRAFLACIVDFIPFWILAPSIGRGFPGIRRRSDQFWFITTGSLSGPTQMFATHYSIQARDRISGTGYANLAEEILRPLTSRRWRSPWL